MSDGAADTMKDAARYTPGPWEFDDSGEYYRRGCIRRNGVVVAFVNRSAVSVPTEPETLANARLIAAAPALYEALRDLVAAVEFRAEGSLMPQSLRAALLADISEARAALKLSCNLPTGHSGACRDTDAIPVPICGRIGLRSVGAMVVPGNILDGGAAWRCDLPVGHGGPHQQETPFEYREWTEDRTP